ncbi:L-fucose:H+ symporter permease [Rodentibacter trehalosifermentans]|uniref:L-fucose:H+ symporter permease n=1 Tax=Rodentibacter trehalosifermentans TaxID=1908263 RepID=UPI000986C35E|nr:L-fucose:H+ symporter permease [Rodentibacter trehalosifermentans]OOF52585.1 L-fucose:H+ symporter permease [Rodentibacter trehalosifermentans]
MSAKVLEKKFIVPFILITSLFALWGFANDITNPMVAVFQTVMEIPASEAALVQFAFYGGYGTMAIPAAIFASRYSYKAGIMLGLILYAIGAFLFWPAAKYEEFNFFLISLYILTFGLAFLETTANPYILAMGDPQTATRRLNFAQSFNPLGSITGMFVASQLVLTNLESDKRDAAGNLIFNTLSEAEKMGIRTHDLAEIRDPYIVLGFVVVAVLIIIGLYKMPKVRVEEGNNRISFKEAVSRLIQIPKYREGVIAQVFYVGVQIMCWTFIVQYAERLGFTKAEGQNFNIIAMGIFIASRFISTSLMKYLKSEFMLMLFAIGGFFSILGVIFIDGVWGLYCLILTSGFMSLMFPTIYGIALHGLKEESTIGAAGLVMAIVGGALMPPLQGMIIDQGEVMGLPAVNFSFILPLICFIVIAIYGFRTWKILK